MKQWFLLLLIAMVPVVILASLVYSFGKYLYAAYDDWREGRQLDAIQVEQKAIRERRREANRIRLNNGCVHAFDSGPGFPPGVCPKCGLAKEKPLESAITSGAASKAPSRPAAVSGAASSTVLPYSLLRPHKTTP
jgi:hypothetical protein